MAKLQEAGTSGGDFVYTDLVRRAKWKFRMKPLKYLLLLLGLFGPLAHTWGAIAYVQRTSSPTCGTSPATVTLPSTVTAGDTILIVALDAAPANSYTLTISDSDSNSYKSSTVYKLSTPNSFKLAVFWITNPNLTTNPPTATVTDGDGSSHLCLSMREYSGVASQTTDASQTADDGDNDSRTGTSTDSQTTQSITTTGSSDILLAGFGDVGGSGCPCSYAAGSGWGHADSFQEGNGNVWGWEDQLNVAAGSYQGAMTRTGTAHSAWAGIIVALKATAAANVTHEIAR